MNNTGTETAKVTSRQGTKLLKPPKKPENLVYGVEDRPPPLMIFLLGLQHVFLMSVGLIFPVLIARSAGATPEATLSLVSLSMLAGGVGTIFQALRNRFIGSGYLCPEGADPSFVPVSIQAAQMGGLPLVYGMTVLSGIFEAFLSRLLYRLRAFFPAEVTGVVVTMVGISVVPLAINNMLGLSGENARVDLGSLGIALLSLAVIISINVWAKGAVRQFALLIGMVFGYLLCLFLGRVAPEQIAQITTASVFNLPSMGHLSWSFDFAMALPFAIAIIGSTLKNVGDVTTCQRINDAAWTRPDIGSIRGGIMADAATTVLAGAVGGMGQASYSANVGLSLATAATSRVLAYSAGGMFILLAFFPKLAAVFAIMPKPVMGAGLIFAVSFMIVAGMQIIMSRLLDSRKIIVVGVSIIFGVGAPILQVAFQDAQPWIKPLVGSSLSVATITVIILNALLRIGVGKRAQIELPREADIAEKATNFLVAHGSAWAARRDIIQRATAALGELAESILTAGLPEGAISLAAEFDEFNLDLFVRYKGQPLSFSREKPDPLSLLEDDGALAKLSSFLVRQYADRVDVKSEGDQCRVHLHFDH